MLFVLSSSLLLQRALMTTKPFGLSPLLTVEDSRIFNCRDSEHVEEMVSPFDAAQASQTCAPRRERSLVLAAFARSVSLGFALAKRRRVGQACKRVNGASPASEKARFRFFAAPCRGHHDNTLLTPFKAGGELVSSPRVASG